MAGHRLLVAVAIAAALLGCRGKEKPVSEPASKELRAPAVAGSFYPSDPAKLKTDVDRYLQGARRAGAAVPEGEEPVLILVPHAGYDFSGPCAAFAWAAVAGRPIDRVLLIGPPHRVAVQGAAVYCGAGFQTPIGTVPVDTALARAIVGSSSVIHDDPAPHVPEHSLEVQLPFLLATLPKASIVPILVMGDEATLDRVAPAIIEAVHSSSGGFARTLVVVSSDLAHYPSQTDAEASDREILSAFCSLDPRKLVATDRAVMARRLPNLECTICGRDAAYVGLQIARAAGATSAHLLDARTSADAGIPGAGADSVVGYGAVLVTRPAVGSGGVDRGSAAKEPAKEPGIPLKEPLTADEQAFLLRIARSSIEEYLKTGSCPTFDVPAGSQHLGEKRGCFVTLYERSGSGLDLRGCIGTHESDLPLVRLIPEMALASAFGDPRFPRLRPDELGNLEIEISVYRSGVVPIASPDDFVVGEEGIILKVGGAEATYLPQVATEQGWDRVATFENLCRKAGLGPDAWKDRDARFSVYVTQAFQEGRAGP
jgi:AmmeMemoRadiSam system protein B/AmmeMemoRadiSam system protein A